MMARIFFWRRGQIQSLRHRAAQLQAEAATLRTQAMIRESQAAKLLLEAVELEKV